MSDESVTSGCNGRDAAGRFAAGNKLARGNPNNKRVQALRKALLEVVEPDAIGRIGRKLVAMGEAGDLEAVRVLFSYTMGRPPQAVELSGPDGEALGWDLDRLRASLLGVLTPYPEAKAAVARELLELARGREEAAGDGPA